MKSLSVGLIDLGENLPVDLEKLARILNKKQLHFNFLKAGSIKLTTIGDPDVEEIFYSLNRLWGLMGNTVAVASFDFVIGVTRLPLAHVEADGKVIDRNYFSLSDLTNLSVVTTHPNVIAFKPRWKTEYQYVAYLAVTELLIGICGNNLMHTLADNCLFDDCVERPRLAECIDKAHICETCRKKLTQAKVSDSLLLDVEAILDWCRSESLRMTFAYALQHPLTGFAFGIGIGWVLSALVTAEHYGVMILAMLSVPLVLWAYRRFFS